MLLRKVGSSDVSHHGVLLWCLHYPLGPGFALARVAAQPRGSSAAERANGCVQGTLGSGVERCRSYRADLTFEPALSAFGYGRSMCFSLATSASEQLEG